MRARALATSGDRRPGRGRRRAALRARLCRWRAAGARKKTSRQMRDAARRISSPPRAVRVLSPAPPYPHKTHRYRRRAWACGRLGSRVVRGGGCGRGRGWCVRVVARGAWRRGQVRARGPRGPGGSRSRQAGDARRPARGAFLLNCDRDQVRNAAASAHCTRDRSNACMFSFNPPRFGSFGADSVESYESLAVLILLINNSRFILNERRGEVNWAKSVRELSIFFQFSNWCRHA